MKLSLSHTHQTNGDIWNPHCRVCGVQLLDGGITPADLCERVSNALQQSVRPTGRVRGSWIEVEEVLDTECWMWWVRPAGNLLGFEAIEHPSSNPTGEELSMAFLAEMLTAPAEEPVPVAISGGAADRRTPHRKASRWQRFKTWSRANAEREFLTIAAPLCIFWAAALFTVLGWDGVKAVCSVLF